MEPCWSKWEPVLAAAGITVDNPPWPESAPSRLLLASQDSRILLGWLLAGLRSDREIFLAHPDWGESSWREAVRLAQPQWAVGEIPEFVFSALRQQDGSPPPSARPGTLWMPTGGSGGQVKFAAHDWSTLLAAAEAYRHFDDGRPYQAVNLLPAYHVGGLLPLFRALQSGGSLRIFSWKRLVAGVKPPSSWWTQATVSLVPTQLDSLLGSVEWTSLLARCHRILLGGAAAPAALLERARRAALPLVPCYGLTETAALITGLPPQDFLAGREGVGKPLCHTRIFITDEQGALLPDGREGHLAIQTTSLARALLPGGPLDSARLFCPGDLGRLDDGGGVHLAGRSDRLILTGGKKANPAFIERILRESGYFADVAVFGLPDPHWGQTVAAAVICQGVPPESGAETWREFFRGKLAAHEIPRHWFPVDNIPRNLMGKIPSDLFLKMMPGARF